MHAQPLFAPSRIPSAHSAGPLHAHPPLPLKTPKRPPRLFRRSSAPTHFCSSKPPAPTAQPFPQPRLRGLDEIPPWLLRSQSIPENLSPAAWASGRPFRSQGSTRIPVAGRWGRGGGGNEGGDGNIHGVSGPLPGVWLEY